MKMLLARKVFILPDIPLVLIYNTLQYGLSF